MSKVSKTYLIIWGAMFVVFNLVVFVSPGWDGLPKYTGSFWAAYAFTTVAFIAHLLLTLWAFKDAEDSKSRMFLNIPIITISYTGLIVSVIAGALCMLNSLLPTWVAVVAMAILLLIYVVSIARTKIAIDVVEQTGAKVAATTSTIKSLRSEAQALVAKASTPEAKDICTKISEALRYADPVSNDMTASIEREIGTKLSELGNSLNNKDENAIFSIGNELVSLIEERNLKCREGKTYA